MVLPDISGAAHERSQTHNIFLYINILYNFISSLQQQKHQQKRQQFFFFLLSAADLNTIEGAVWLFRVGREYAKRTNHKLGRISSLAR